MKTKTQKTIEKIIVNGLLNQVPCNIDKNIRLNRLRRYLIIGYIKSKAYYFTPKAFFNRYNNEKIKSFDQIFITDILI